MTDLVTYMRRTGDGKDHNMRKWLPLIAVCAGTFMLLVAVLGVTNRGTASSQESTTQ